MKQTDRKKVEGEGTSSGQLKRHVQQNPLFLLVETDFLASGNRFLLFRYFSSEWKSSLKLVKANF